MVVRASTDRCPECGLELPGESWSTGLCPRCLFELAVEESPAEAPTLAAPSELYGESPTALYSESPVGDEESLNPGQLLGHRYRIESLLGRGGMGEVWRAYDLKLRLEVALKSLHPNLFETEDALELLRDEVRAAREVTSPNVCRLYDLIEVGGRELVSMEYIDGVTLLDHLKKCGPLELKEANEIASQLLAGLEAVHEARLVHRDIKPENVMLTRTGRVVLMDFGLTSPSGSGSIGGTPAYMPPEQASGEATDARADVFSIGIVLAEMLSAERGPEESSRQTFWERIREEPPELPESPWKPILIRAVSPDANERYATSIELARALEEVAFRVEGVEHEHPYPGLASFQEGDAEFFFGREAEVEAMWKKLQQSQLLGLIGPSGSGKSSFLNAGLLPASPEGWLCVRMSPSTDPFAALGRALLPELETDREAMGFLSSLEGREPALEVLRKQRAKHGGLLIIVDQFEELFTQCSEDTQRRFVELLGRAALEADVHVLLSMRDDYLFHCQAFEALKLLFSELTPLGPPTGSSLRRAIIQPALRCGYRFEDETIVEEMLHEVTKERAALPLIAFTASQLWERRDRETGYLTREAYDVVGGVGGALAQHAESTLDRIGQDSIPIVREFFRNLVTAQGTRASRDRDELLSVFAAKRGQAPFLGVDESSGRGLKEKVPVPFLPAEQVLDSLIDSRLLTAFEIPEREGRPGHQRVEIVHESLLTAWPRLVRWQMQDAEGAHLRDELRQAAQLWEQHERSEDRLWTGTAFQEFQIWRERYPGRLSSQEEAFAEAITTYAERRQRRRRMAVAAVLIVAFLVAAVTGGLWLRADAEARRAEAANLRSLAQLRLEKHPTAALAFATASLDMNDNAEARRLALKALWKGPTELRLPASGWLSINFSPDGKWLATSDCELWPSDGGAATALEGCEGANEGSFSPDGGRFALTQGVDRADLGIWSVPQGQRLQSLELGGSLSYFRFSPGGQRLVTSTEHFDQKTYTAELRSWSLETGEPAEIGKIEIPRESSGTLAEADPTLTRVVWAEESRLALAELDGTNLDLGTATFIEHDRQVAMATFNGAGNRLATYDVDQTPRIWSLEVRPPRLLRTLPAADLAYLMLTPAALRFDSTGTKLGHALGFVWDLKTPPDSEPLWLRRAAVDFEQDATEFGLGVAFDPTGRWAATARGESISFWPLSRAFPRIFAGHEERVREFGISPDGKWLVSASGTGNGTVRLWALDPASEERSRILHEPEGGIYDGPNCLTMAPDGAFAVMGTYFGEVKVLPIEGDDKRKLGGFTDMVSAVGVSPNGQLVAAGTSGWYESIVKVWDLETGEARTFERENGGATGWLEFEDEDRLLVIGSGQILRWDLSGSAPPSLVATDLPGRTVDFRNDLRRALFRDDERRVWLYDLDSHTSRELTAHGGLVSHAKLDPSGEIVVSTNLQSAVQVARLDDKEPHLLLGHEGAAIGVVFTPDGQWIASGAEDRLIYLWPMPNLDEPPLHTLPKDELIAKLRSLTNIRTTVAPDSPTGWKLSLDPFPGWEEVPVW